MQARFGILQVLLEAGEGACLDGINRSFHPPQPTQPQTDQITNISGFVTIAEHPEKGVTVAIDRAKIETVGMPAIEVCYALFGLRFRGVL